MFTPAFVFSFCTKNSWSEIIFQRLNVDYNLYKHIRFILIIETPFNNPKGPKTIQILFKIFGN